ncbi:MAG: hypothetical protein GC192_18625 [Bacteroidetes bacterium]|nr:hypothetical protein [Bacteroidota bacterium]
MRSILIFLAIVALSDCKTKMGAADANCKTEGTIVDMDGLDGCGYLIRLKDGKLLNPIEFPENFSPKKGQNIRFDYQPLHDMASVCMAESEIIQITCVEDVKANNEPVECSKISNPFAVDWMSKAIDRHNPTRIIKFQMGGKWAFAFQAEPNSTYLYDCDGVLICQSNGDQNDECHTQHLNFISKGKTIWQGEGVWD